MQKKTAPQATDREKTIRAFFQMWVERDFTGLDGLFSPDVEYSECYGPEYRGRKELHLWIADLLQKQQVLEWRIKRFLHAQDTVVVEWFFKERQDAAVKSFDGVSLIEFGADGKMVSVKEFQSKAEHRAPYRQKNAE